MSVSERVFTVFPEKLPILAPPLTIEQVYISGEPAIFCVQTKEYAGATATAYFTMLETEFTESTEIWTPFDLNTARKIMGGGLWQHAIGKERHSIDQVDFRRRYPAYVGNSLRWEVDSYLGGLEGLCLARTQELGNIDPPPWVDSEVTGDLRYSDYRLSSEGWPLPESMVYVHA